MELRIFNSTEVIANAEPDSNGNIKAYYEERCGKYVCVSEELVNKIGHKKAQKLIDEAFEKALRPVCNTALK